MASGIEASTTVGVTGQTWRASVASWGAVTPWLDVANPPSDGSGTAETLDWFIAADDRWHNPAEEAAVRQRRIDGTPVLETRMRIPDGDAVQRVWSVADGGGMTIIEVENDSPLPFAIAFSGLDVLTERPPTGVPIQGIELPADAISLPVGHHSSIRVAIAHHDRGVENPRLPAAAAATAVARGWVSLAERASRLDLPDGGLAEAVVAARCDLMLEGPIDAEADPVGFVLDVGELVRLGDDPAAWLQEVVVPLEAAARSDDPLLGAAIDAALRVAGGAGDRRAAKDLQRLRRRVATRREAGALTTFSDLRRSGAVGRFVTEVETHLVHRGDLLPIGIPTRWLGTNFELHDVPTSGESTVSLAVRWHGERPAVLWEQSGRPQRLTASAVDPTWSTDAPSGEGLWVAPARPSNPSTLAVTAVGEPNDTSSTTFS